MEKELDYYMKLPYKIEILQNSDGAYFARVPELPGCMTEANTKEEILEMIEDAKRSWLTKALEHGDPIPEPRSEEKCAVAN